MPFKQAQWVKINWLSPDDAPGPLMIIHEIGQKETIFQHFNTGHVYKLTQNPYQWWLADQPK